MKKILLRLVLSASLLLGFCLYVDWSLIASAIGGIEPLPYLVSTAITMSSTVFVAGKYRLLVRDTPLSLPVARLVAIQFISRFYALFLPGFLGTEVVRWFKVTRNRGGKSRFLAATAYERLIFLLVLLASGLVPLFFYGQHPRIAQLRQHLLPAGLCVVGVVAACLCYLLSRRLQTMAHKLIPTGGSSRLDRFLANLTLADRSPTLLISLVFLSGCWQLFFAVRIYMLFQSMGLSLGLAEAAWMGSLVLLLQILPVSFAGLGVREGAWAYLMTVFTLPAESGLVLGILFFTQMLVLAAVGAVLNLLEK